MKKLTGVIQNVNYSNFKLFSKFYIFKYSKYYIKNEIKNLYNIKDFRQEVKFNDKVIVLAKNQGKRKFYLMKIFNT